MSGRRSRPREEHALTSATLAAVRHAGLRAEAAAALGRGEGVQLLVGAQGDTRVETVVAAGGRAAQSSGETLLRGAWNGERLVTERGGHLLDADGFCFCRSCEEAAGWCVDDDE